MRLRAYCKHSSLSLAFPTLALAVLLAAPAAAQEVTLEGLLSAPFPTELRAARSGGRVAWVLNAEGRRNIWVADPPDYRGRQVTAYTRDDGQEIAGLAFSPDGRTLVYVRGGGPNRAGEVPNPVSDPAGVEQAVWRVSLEGGDPVRVGVGSSPAISPKGDGFAFVRQSQIWWAPLDGSKEPAQLLRARGGAGSLRWSPDGSKLAFVSGRGDHSFVGVYDVASKELRWVQPSVDRDGSPVWSPDGKRLAFIRMPAASPRRPPIFSPVRAAQPWSIHVADAATGEAREVWRADEGSGSAFWGVQAENQLLWGADDRLVFPWEKTGWLLLYAIPAAGGRPTLLTPGEFEVEYVALGPDGADVIYNSNEGDVDRRHLWRVPVSGGARPTRVTGGAGIEWLPAPTADGRAVAYLRSDARLPAHAAILEGRGEGRELAPGSIPAAFPARSLVEPESVVITAADGTRVRAQLFLPRRGRGERRPAVVFLHGGSRRQMLLGWNYGSYYHNAYALNQYLAAQGYVVLSLNYRSGIGYGLEFREALNYGATGGSEFYDVLGAGLYLRSRPDVDTARIGLWGGSYGGYLTAMGLARASELFAAGVDFHGVHDWNVGIRTFIPSYNTLELPEESRTAFMASPMSSLDTWRSPVLVIHGDDDRNVSFAETVVLVEKLRERGVEVEQLVFPDEVHGFLRHESWLRAYRAAAEFLERKLEGR